MPQGIHTYKTTFMQKGRRVHKRSAEVNALKRVVMQGKNPYVLQTECLRGSVRTKRHMYAPRTYRQDCMDMFFLITMLAINLFAQHIVDIRAKFFFGIPIKGKMFLSVQKCSATSRHA